MRQKFLPISQCERMRCFNATPISPPQVVPPPPNVFDFKVKRLINSFVFGKRIMSRLPKLLCQKKSMSMIMNVYLLILVFFSLRECFLLAFWSHGHAEISTFRLLRWRCGENSVQLNSVQSFSANSSSFQSLAID